MATKALKTIEYQMLELICYTNVYHGIVVKSFVCLHKITLQKHNNHQPICKETITTLAE